MLEGRAIFGQSERDEMIRGEFESMGFSEKGNSPFGEGRGKSVMMIPEWMRKFLEKIQEWFEGKWFGECQSTVARPLLHYFGERADAAMGVVGRPLTVG